ncbi:putative IMV envelope protein [Fowlpox virus]|uniref:IMV envelope protein n=2 Tax=Avipoxvirus TaxID=10260 RepID=A0A098AQ41_CNPV|nr:putative IMV envelope protein [Fowlpox virus]CDQ47757.1 IMV envelope protein [Canarypox virus]CEO43672.1 IMV envelope protein [Canarypox virus]
MERRNNLMGLDNNKQVIFVINAIGRSPSVVIPSKNIDILEWSYLKTIKYGYEDDDRSPSPPLPPPSEKDKFVPEPKIGKLENDRFYDETIAVRDAFYSDLCRLTCTDETKNFIANHVSLWKYIIDNSAKLPEYIIIIEDDNTVTSETFITKINDIINTLKINNINFLQLVTHNKILKDRESKNIMLLPDLEIYKGGIDISLSAYIVNQEIVQKLYSYFTNNKPSLDISLELIRVETNLGINRYVMSNEQYIKHDYTLVNEFRNSKKAKSSIKSRINNWIMYNYPSFYNTMYSPLFSLFGRYDISALFLIAVVIIIGLAIFDVNNKLVWLLAGIFFAYSFD